jgi:hypothetical protein
MVAGWGIDDAGAEVSMIASRDLLQRLKAELGFLESGGYRRSGSPWRAAYVFEESPSCPNFSDRSRSHTCDECWMIEFVPPDLRDEQVPCRFIELAANGVTVDSLYRHGTPAETEEALRKWLHERIHELESELSEAAQLPFAVNG